MRFSVAKPIIWATPSCASSPTSDCSDAHGLLWRPGLQSDSDWSGGVQDPTFKVMANMCIHLIIAMDLQPKAIVDVLHVHYTFNRSLYLYRR